MCLLFIPMFPDANDVGDARKSRLMIRIWKLARNILIFWLDKFTKFATFILRLSSILAPITLVLGMAITTLVLIILVPWLSQL
jgi:hypothetical protein